MFCKTCMFWEKDPYEEDWGTCIKMQGKCGGHKITYTKAWASDCEAYSAWVNTRFDFGCVMYEKRETND